jgi:asparagine synthase (glutamine-hydrolysing)
MCGIWGVLAQEAAHTNGVDTLKARGPEGTQVKTLPGQATLGFTRLAINGLTNAGMQPMEWNGIWWVTNGEIYNWKSIQRMEEFTCSTGSDCEVIGRLFDKYGIENAPRIFDMLDGVFATCVVDTKRGLAILGRDPYGVRPLFRGTHTAKSKATWFGSEYKSLIDSCDSITHVEPGTCELYSLETGERISTVKYHTLRLDKSETMTVDDAAAKIRILLEDAVKKRLMTERPVAALLSGGIDSSLIASLVARFLREAGAPPLKTFSIGMEGSSDLAYARKVADWIGSEHHEIVMTAEEFWAAVPDVIYSIESFDTTTVRASVGNWLVAREVAKRSDCKVVFNGDGSDEAFGSYLYFFKAPSDDAFEEEVLRLLKDIHCFDVLRSDRSISTHGLEPRTPFLDKGFVQAVMSIPIRYRRPGPDQCEKWILRKAFDDGVTLPHEVLWRRKEAFSDGVSGKDKSWYEIAKENSVKLVESDWEHHAVVKKGVQPRTEEQYYYRDICESYFGTGIFSIVPYFWMPKWCEGATDPSARTLTHYAQE